MKKIIPPSEMIINDDGSIFHLHLKPEQLTDNIILVGDPGRLELVASFFDTRDFDVQSRELKFQAYSLTSRKMKKSRSRTPRICERKIFTLELKASAEALVAR